MSSLPAAVVKIEMDPDPESLSGSGVEEMNVDVTVDDGEAETVPLIRPLRSCTIPLVREPVPKSSSSRSGAGAGSGPNIYQAKINKLESRVQFLERHLTFLQRRVRAMEMGRTEDVRRTVLQVLSNQTFSIPIQFDGKLSLTLNSKITLLLQLGFATCEEQTMNYVYISFIPNFIKN